MSDSFRFLLRVRYGECDAQGVVFNARWGDYVDVAVTEYARALFGTTDVAVAGEWQLVKQTLQWRASAGYDDVLEVQVQTGALGTTSFTIASEFRRHGAASVLATAETVYVMIDPVARTKVAITPAQRLALERGAPGLVVDHAGAMGV
jgi:acyl-CoA thioester hydrolase